MAMQIFRITTSQQNILPIPSHFMFLLYRATYNSTRMVMFFRELPFFPTYKSLFINSPISKISLTKSVFIPWLELIPFLLSSSLIVPNLTECSFWSFFFLPFPNTPWSQRSSRFTQFYVFKTHFLAWDNAMIGPRLKKKEKSKKKFFHQHKELTDNACLKNKYMV